MKKQANGGRSLIASFVASALASAACVPSLTWAQESGATLEGKAEADSEIGHGTTIRVILPVVTQT